MELDGVEHGVMLSKHVAVDCRSLIRYFQDREVSSRRKSFTDFVFIIGIIFLVYFLPQNSFERNDPQKRREIIQLKSRVSLNQINIIRKANDSLKR